MTPIEARPHGGWQQQVRVPSSAVTSCMPCHPHHFTRPSAASLSIFQPPALALARGQMHPDTVQVIGHHVMRLGPEGPGRQLHGPAEEAQDRVDAAVVAGQRAPARKMPDDLGVEQLAQSVHVPWRTRRSLCGQAPRLGVPSPPPLLAECPQATTSSVDR